MPSRDVEEMLAELAAKEEADANRPMGECIRVLQCFECKTTEVLPDYPQGANPQNDATLHYVDLKHGGATEQPHYRALHRVEKVIWDDRKAQKQIVDNMWADVKGFTPSYYDVQDQLKADAMQCWKEHRQPTADRPCLDYRSHEKVIKPPTRKERKQAARELELAGQRNNIDLDRLANDMPTLFLCSFCPFQGVMDHHNRMMRGEA